MANIDITDQGGGGGTPISNGVLQLENGATMSASLQYVTDLTNTKSPLKLSTTAVQVESPLRITTSDASGFYIDAEDSTTNNRFSIKRDPSSQQVTLDFASNPVGSTTIVGSIRTYKDGVNLGDTMVFREDGNVGIGAASPSGLLHVDGGVNVPRIILDADTNVARIFSFRTNDTQRWAFRIDDNETGTNAGSNFAIRRYNDAGTFIDAPFIIRRSTGNIGINTSPGGSKVYLKGTGATGATSSLYVDNSNSTPVLNVRDNAQVDIGSGPNGIGSLYVGNSIAVGYTAAVGAAQSIYVGGSGSALNSNSLAIASGNFSGGTGNALATRYLVSASPSSVGAGSSTNLQCILNQKIFIAADTSSGVNSYYYAALISIDLNVFEASSAGSSNLFTGTFKLNIKRYLIGGTGTFTDISTPQLLYSQSDVALGGTTINVTALNGPPYELNIAVVLPPTANTASYRMAAIVDVTKVNNF